MNNFNASLLDPGTVDFDTASWNNDTTDVINQYQQRACVPYFSPAHIIQAFPILGPFGIPYKMFGLPVQTCTNMYISAPTPYQASSITHQANTLYTAGQYGIGQAPTSGIFTGVEDKC